MPLISLWKTNPKAVDQFSIEQVVSAAGDGVLRDGSVCSQELTDFLAQVPSHKLSRYIQQCLASKYDRSGMALQDLINELGRRLDYKVENGRYQGVVNASGHDGLWTSPEGQTLIIEVKTTDAYRISLDTIVGYRAKLSHDRVDLENASVLLVVGRQDTGELEAQVRGSRHAWDIRIVSAEALTKLVTLKENSDEAETGQKIRSVLLPVEYTRLDRLVDVMFTTASDVETDLATVAVTAPVTAPTPPNPVTEADTAYEFTDAALLQAKRAQIVAAMSKRLNSTLVRNTRALYWSADHSLRIACTISKRYTKKNAVPYWYAYHPQWDDFLRQAYDGSGYLVLGCMDLDRAFAIPRQVMVELLDKLNTTEADRGTSYWHIHLADGGHGLELVVPRHRNIPLAPYAVPIAS